MNFNYLLIGGSRVSRWLSTGLALLACVVAVVYLTQFATPPFGRGRAVLVALATAAATACALVVLLSVGLAALFRLRRLHHRRAAHGQGAVLAFGGVSALIALALPLAADWLHLTKIQGGTGVDWALRWSGVQTLLLLVLFMYCGLWALRLALADQGRREAASALYALVATLMLPPVFYAASWWGSRAEVALGQNSTTVGTLAADTPSFTSLVGMPFAGYALVALTWFLCGWALHTWASACDATGRDLAERRGRLMRLVEAKSTT